MRDRHNIVGSEVGRPRPPVYTLRTLKLAKRRAPFRWVWFWTGAATLFLASLVFVWTQF